VHDANRPSPRQAVVRKVELEIAISPAIDLMQAAVRLEHPRVMRCASSDRRKV
jgi:hypothetical protein